MFLNFFFLQVLNDHFVCLPWKTTSLLPPSPFKTCVNVLLACRYVYHMYAWYLRRPVPLELALQMIVSCHMVLRIKPGSSGRTISALSC